MLLCCHSNAAISADSTANSLSPSRSPRMLASKPQDVTACVICSFVSWLPNAVIRLLTSVLRRRANPAYNITTPAITALIESKCFESITVLVQKEVAERLCAAPGTSAYGAFSVFMQYYTEPELLFAVPRECFEPQPKVTSAVLRAVVRREPPVEVEDEKFFFRVVYAAFALRRKTLVNSLMTAFGSQLTKEQVTQAVTSCGLEANIRGERLGLSEFAALAKAIHALV